MRQVGTHSLTFVLSCDMHIIVHVLTHTHIHITYYTPYTLHITHYTLHNTRTYTDNTWKSKYPMKSVGRSFWRRASDIPPCGPRRDQYNNIGSWEADKGLQQAGKKIKAFKKRHWRPKATFRMKRTSKSWPGNPPLNSFPGRCPGMCEPHET